jgi:hypothetical protein
LASCGSTIMAPSPLLRDPVRLRIPLRLSVESDTFLKDFVRRTTEDVSTLEVSPSPGLGDIDDLVDDDAGDPVVDAADDNDSWSGFTDEMLDKAGDKLPETWEEDVDEDDCEDDEVCKHAAGSLSFSATVDVGVTVVAVDMLLSDDKSAEALTEMGGADIFAEVSVALMGDSLARCRDSSENLKALVSLLSALAHVDGPNLGLGLLDFVGDRLAIVLLMDDSTCLI